MRIGSRLAAVSLLSRTVSRVEVECMKRNTRRGSSERSPEELGWGSGLHIPDSCLVAELGTSAEWEWVF